MNMKSSGGPAFPTSDQQAAHTIAAAAISEIKDTAERDRVYTAARAQAQQGMTLRDYFAAQALNAVINMDYPMSDLGYSMKDGKSIGENYAICAYELADAMLAARSTA